MNQQTVPHLRHQRQPGQKRPLIRPQPASGPLQRNPCIGAEILRAALDRRIMVALQTDRPGCRQRHHLVTTPVRVRPIADIVAQQGNPVTPPRRHIRQNSRKALLVAMNIRDQRQPHSPSNPPETPKINLKFSPLSFWHKYPTGAGANAPWHSCPGV